MTFPLRLPLHLLAFPVLTLLGSCGSSEKADLPDAVYATQLPLYPGAKLESMMGGTAYADLDGPVVSESQSWFFKVKDPKPEVVDYYKEKLPEAEQGGDADDAFTFTLKPVGGEEGEELKVSIRDGEVQFTEELKPGKRPKEKDVLDNADKLL